MFSKSKTINILRMTPPMTIPFRGFCSVAMNLVIQMMHFINTILIMSPFAWSFIRHDVHHRPSRQTNQLVTPQINSESGRRRFLYSIPIKFHELSPVMRDLWISLFKLELRYLILRGQLWYRLFDVCITLLPCVWSPFYPLLFFVTRGAE